MKPIKGYRTIIWNVANAVVYAMELSNTQYGIPEGWEPVWLAVYILGNIALRLFTTTPVGRKE